MIHHPDLAVVSDTDGDRLESHQNFANQLRLVTSQVINGDLPSGPGYVRLETVTQTDQDTFRCFTNPIWIKVADSGKRQLCVNCAS